MNYDPAPFIRKLNIPGSMNVDFWSFASGAPAEKIEALRNERIEYLRSAEALKAMPEELPE